MAAMRYVFHFQLTSDSDIGPEGVRSLRSISAKTLVVQSFQEKLVQRADLTNEPIQIVHVYQ